MKVKKGDLVQMLTGKDRGKQGRILDAQPRAGRVIVENLNVSHRHQKPQPIRDASRMGGTQMTPGRDHRQADGRSGRQRDGRLPDVQAADAGRLSAPRRSRARPSRCASASARAAARRSTSSDGHRPRDLHPAPQAALQRRAPRSSCRRSSASPRSCRCRGSRRSPSTWASARRRPTPRCSTRRWTS